MGEANARRSIFYIEGKESAEGKENTTNVEKVRESSVFVNLLCQRREKEKALGKKKRSSGEGRKKRNGLEENTKKNEGRHVSDIR